MVFCFLAMTAPGTEPISPGVGQSQARATITLPRSMRYLGQRPSGFAADKRHRPQLVFLHISGGRGQDLKQVEVKRPAEIHRPREGTSFHRGVAPMPRWFAVLWVGDRRLGRAVGSPRSGGPETGYLTGLSLGGYRVWESVIFSPERSAAIFPVCGGGPWAEEANRLKGVAVWALPGAKDPYVPLQEAKDHVAAAIAAGGEAKITVHPEAGQNRWTETYANPEIPLVAGARGAGRRERRMKWSVRSNGSTCVD